MTYFVSLLIWSILATCSGEDTNVEKQVAATCYTSSENFERLKSFDITMIVLALNKNIKKKH